MRVSGRDINERVLQVFAVNQMCLCSLLELLSDFVDTLSRFQQMAMAADQFVQFGVLFDPLRDTVVPLLSTLLIWPLTNSNGLSFQQLLQLGFDRFAIHKDATPFG